MADGTSTTNMETPLPSNPKLLVALYKPGDSEDKWTIIFDAVWRSPVLDLDIYRMITRAYVGYVLTQRVIDFVVLTKVEELKPPRAHRPRFAMVHAGNGIGFVEAAELTFLCKKNTADAHDEMDGDIYEKWFSEQLLPNTPEGAVIVIDNAAYHNRREDRKKEISPEIYKLRDMSTIPLQVFINPEMKVQNYEKLVFPEGCESVRGFAADVPRYKEVTVSVKYHFIMLF
uniref:Peptide deformylase n=1 Tax=Timema genevievae TaxID=629358 RepID=A0A7R9PQG5_TIMGE|nr:unnamed protein product [Timema genevievae]